MWCLGMEVRRCLGEATKTRQGRIQGSGLLDERWGLLVEDERGGGCISNLVPRSKKAVKPNDGLCADL